MQDHELDPVSGALGAIAIVLGGLVATGSVERLDVHGVWLGVAVAGLTGLILLAAATRQLRTDTTTNEPRS
jgi:hypothetical protein